MEIKTGFTMGNVFKKVCIEITDGCNATCKWCTTGIRNRAAIERPFHFLSFEEFCKVMDFLEKANLTDSETEIELYNWGEPFLNPQMTAMLDDVIARGYPFHLSTNGSKYIEFTPEQIKKMDYLTFSMSGITQESYAKIHGLNLKSVLGNIRKTANLFRTFGAEKKVMVNFHIYQFNLDEIWDANAFAEELGISFVPTYAYFNDYELFDGYLSKNRLPQKSDVSLWDVFTYYFTKLREEQPDGYQCPEWSNLTLDSYLRVVPCCRLTAEKDSVGMLSSISGQNIGCPQSSRCSTCLECGQAYITHSRVLIPDWYKHCQERIMSIKTELDTYGVNLKKALEQTSSLEKQVADYDFNLKKALEQISALKAQVADYDFNLKKALEQISALKAQVADYDFNLKKALERASVLETQVVDYDTHLKRALAEKAELSSRLTEYDESLRIALENVGLAEDLYQILERRPGLLPLPIRSLEDRMARYSYLIDILYRKSDELEAIKSTFWYRYFYRKKEG